MNIGIDFGSTYTTVSAFNPVLDMPEAIKLDSSQPDSIPSIVCIKTRNGKEPMKHAGFNARDQINAGSRNLKIYKAFKMLLVETDEQILSKYGYDKEHTPRSIAAFFLASILKGVKDRRMKSDEQFDNIYICVPEIWVSQIKSDGRKSISRTLDGRPVLHEIIRELASADGQDGSEGLPINLEGVHVVTEPEAASAFFAYNYMRTENTPFNGHLLLIDYGGGTLDLTLTEIVSTDSKGVEITRRDNGGAGENHLDPNGHLYQVGNAGIAFQRAVLKHALADAGIENFDTDSIVYAAAEKELEAILKNPQTKTSMMQVLESYGPYSEYDAMLSDEPFPLTADDQEVTLSYDGDDIPLTYQQLYLAYKETAEGVVRREIDKICDRTAKKLGFDPRDMNTGKRNDFKVALVGGFSACYFVQKQIEDIFHALSDLEMDKRFSSMNSDQRELAISLGASLLAEQRVTLRKTARYSVGVVSNIGSGGRNVPVVRYGIKYGQVIEPGAPYYILCDNQQERQPYGGSVRKNITEFVIEDTARQDHGYVMPLKPLLQEKLGVVEDEIMWNIGFSINSSDVLSIHFVQNEVGTKRHDIPLERYSELFELSNPRVIEKKPNGQWVFND